MDPAGDVVILVIAAGRVFVVSNVAGGKSFRHNIRPGKGKYPLVCSISFIAGQAGVIFISNTYVIICGVRLALKKLVLIIWPEINPLFINVSARGSIAVSNFDPKTSAIQVDINGLKKCALLAVGLSTLTEPLAQIS